MFDFYYNLTRDYMFIKYTGKNFKITRIPDIRICILGYNYNYVIKIVI